ncbi:MAG: protein jag [Eubacteriales bacterium]|jgi:spoIIIJ-associated protein|nr:protein jag [Eubacteriales bacterium]
MNKIEVSAKTVDEAIKSALLKLGIEKDDAIIEVLDEGSRGFLGLGGKDAIVRVTAKENPVETAKEFLSQLIEKMSLDCDVASTQEDDTIKLIISGDGVGGVIGRRGETLDAVQYLVNLYVNKGKRGDDYRRIIVDTENYRARREETLIRLANSMASKAVKYRRDMTLEPMSPYERRIIHTALQDHKQVTTKSVGVDPHRRIVVSPKKG